MAPNEIHRVPRVEVLVEGRFVVLLPIVEIEIIAMDADHPWPASARLRVNSTSVT